MKRTISVAMMMLAPWPCWQAASAGEAGAISPGDKGSIAYQRAERQYDDLGNAYVRSASPVRSASICSTRSAEVVEKQKILASSVAHLSAKDGEKVLLFAVAANDPTDAGRLLAEGAARTGDDGSLLHTAATFGDAPLLEMLVDAGFGIEDLGGASGPALMDAVTSGRRDNAEWLIRHGANVNAVDAQRFSVLNHAILCKDQDLVDLLTRAGARADEMTPELATEQGSVAYQWAERQYYDLAGTWLSSESRCPPRTARVVEKQKILASSVAHLSAKDGERVLLFAVTANDPTDVGRLLAEGAARTGDNGSLLHSAARFADAPVLEMLVDAGFGIEDHGGASASALFTAVTSGRQDNATWLIQHGADVNARTVPDGAPVLRYALICKDQSLVSELIRAGARSDARTTALAAKQGIDLR